MSTFARLGSVLILALSLVACGGRGIYDFGDDDGGATADSEGIDSPGEDTNVIRFEDTSVIEYDAPWWDEDTGVGPVADTGVVPSKDSGVIPGPDTSYIGTDTAVPPDAPSTVPITCSKIAKATCTPAFKACCEASGFVWDAIACDDVMRLWCNNNADGVTAGKTTYNPAWQDACAAGWAANTSACQPHIFDWLKNQAACSQLFNGRTPVGGTCTRQSDCRAGLGEVAYCDETGGRCRTIGVVGMGQTCNYFGAAVHWCDRTLTCDPTTAKCVSATPTGGTCFGADDTACGIGNTCKAGKCAVGAPVGAACMRDMECGSWECEFGKCTDIRHKVANKTQCTGF